MNRPEESESLVERAQALRSGALDLHEHLSKLEDVHKRIEPDVLAFVPHEGRFERVHQQADELLRNYPDPATRPPLFGLTVGVKDIFHVDGFVTEAGVERPTDVLQGPEAESIHRLRSAGALIIGKTVTTEFGYFAPGPTRNPRNPEYTPGGSSSGSAAAIAAGLCDIGLGSQTIGSVIRPGAYCGVVGFKPTYDRISRVGFIPLAPSLDVVGFHVTDAAGARLVASQLCFEWSALDVETLPVLGVPEGAYLEQAQSIGLQHFNEVVHHLESQGFDIRFIRALEDFEEIQARHLLIMMGDAARVHSRWFSQYVDQYHWSTLKLVEEGRKISDEQLAQARQEALLLRETIQRQMDDQGLDLWLTPAAPGPAPRGIETTGNPVMNLPWSHTGLPAIGLPAGTDAHGLPLGIQLVGRWYGEELLISQAIQVERALASFAWKAPEGVGEAEVKEWEL
jgi:Asp-tRNA(Asn)/Glu-tRNA(Gln) amidotransferase A subunit family amidase